MKRAVLPLVIGPLDQKLLAVRLHLYVRVDRLGELPLRALYAHHGALDLHLDPGRDHDWLLADP